jgi:D-alanyl-D-alanine dipeptidase
MTFIGADRLTTIPDYEWCGVDPTALAFPPATIAAPPIPLDLVAPDDDLLPPVVGGGSANAEHLVTIFHPRIRVIGSYWHSGWGYARPQAFVRFGVAERLADAVDALPPGFGLAIWDAWRDPRLQARLYTVAYSDPTLPAGFVSPASADPLRPAPHATGGTVDLTLTWQNHPLNLGTTFDEFVDRAHAAAFEVETPGSDQFRGGTDIRDLRRMLRQVMCSVGFVQLACEWWHFEVGTRLWAYVRNEAPRYGAIMVD